MFIVRKILGSRINVPEPEMHVSGTAITAGMALNLTGGTLAKTTAAPTHIALADAASGEQVACYAVLPGTMIFEVPVSAAPTSLKEGDKVTIDSGALNVTATTTNGVATIVDLNGATAAGDTVMVKF